MPQHLVLETRTHPGSSAGVVLWYSVWGATARFCSRGNRREVWSCAEERSRRLPAIQRPAGRPNSKQSASRGTRGKREDGELHAVEVRGNERSDRRTGRGGGVERLRKRRSSGHGRAWQWDIANKGRAEFHSTVTVLASRADASSHQSARLGAAGCPEGAAWWDPSKRPHGLPVVEGLTSQRRRINLPRTAHQTHRSLGLLFSSPVRLFPISTNISQP